MRDVAEYDGIKYSLQPHGMKSKLIAALVFFVVAFGGALAAASPAQAGLGDITCSIDMASPVPSGSPTPSPTPSPTACPTPPPVTITVPGPTVTVVKTTTKTVYLTDTKTEIVTQTVTPPAPSLTPTPSETPPPALADAADTSGNPLIPWGMGVAGLGGAALLIVGGAGIVRRRRYQGAHHADNTETTMIPAVRDDHYSLKDYDPSENDYDPALGGYAGDSYDEYPHEPATGETALIPRVDDTKVMPPVE